MKHVAMDSTTAPWLNWIELSSEYFTYFCGFENFKILLKQNMTVRLFFCLSLLKVTFQQTKHTHLAALLKFSFWVIHRHQINSNSIVIITDIVNFTLIFINYLVCIQFPASFAFAADC